MENETIAQCNARRRHDYEAAAARTSQIFEEREDKREELEWELQGGKKKWEERVRKRKRAEIVLWNVGDDEEKATNEESAALPQQNTSQGSPEPPPNSSLSQLAQAAGDPRPAPRVGRGVGMDIGGVELIDAGSISKASQSKEVVFDDDGASIAANETDETVATYQLTNGEENLNTRDLATGVKPWRKRKRELKLRTGVPVDDESSGDHSDSSSTNDHGTKRGWEEMEESIKSFLK